MNIEIGIILIHLEIFCRFVLRKFAVCSFSLPHWSALIHLCVLLKILSMNRYNYAHRVGRFECLSACVLLSLLSLYLSIPFDIFAETD